MKNATSGGGGAGQRVAKPDPQSTAENRGIQAAARAIEAGLIALPHPIHLADILHRRPNVPRRVWGATSFALSLPRDRAEELARALLADLRPADPMGSELFRRIAAKHVGQHLLPPPPRGYDPFAVTPRARLVSAWAEASPRDQRDLIERATRRAP